MDSAPSHSFLFVDTDKAEDAPLSKSGLLLSCMNANRGCRHSCLNSVFIVHFGKDIIRELVYFMSLHTLYACRICFANKSFNCRTQALRLAKGCRESIIIREFILFYFCYKPLSMKTIIFKTTI